MRLHRVDLCVVEEIWSSALGLGGHQASCSRRSTDVANYIQGATSSAEL